MNEKRFSETERNCYYTSLVFDNQTQEELGIPKVVELLNEQQELIEELHISDHMGWGRTEKFEKELKQKKIYIKRLEYKVQKFKEENEQLKSELHMRKMSATNDLMSRR